MDLVLAGGRLLQPHPGALTPEQVGTAITGIVTGSDDDRDAYLLTATGLSPAP